jgi:Zn-finger nucleic acid-binding protein
MRCPVCTDETLVISSREGIEIDHCPQCRGVWLDRGELDKIIERAAPSVVGSGPAAAPPPPQSAHDDRRYDERYERPRYEQPRYEQPRYEQPRYDDRARYDKRRKRKSFLEEIFDFD